MSKLLSDFVAGESGKIKAVTGEGRIRRRLFDMGVTPGAELTSAARRPYGNNAQRLRAYVEKSGSGMRRS